MLNTHILLYFITHFAYGPILNSFGPIIPYLAEDTQRTED